MKFYTIVFPDERGNDKWETLSEQDIIDQYYTYWSTKMIQSGHGADISRENCIDDWCVVHWAERNYWREMKDCIA